MTTCTDYRGTCSAEGLHIEVTLLRVPRDNEVVAADDLVAQPCGSTGRADLEALAEGKQKGTIERQHRAAEVFSGLISICRPPAEGNLREIIMLKCT